MFQDVHHYCSGRAPHLKEHLHTPKSLAKPCEGGLAMCKQFNGVGCRLSLRPKRAGCDKQTGRTALRAARRGALRKGVVGPGLKTLRELLGAARRAVRYTSAEQLGAQEA